MPLWLGVELVGLESVYPVHRVGYCHRCPDETHVCHKGKLVVKQLMVWLSHTVYICWSGCLCGGVILFLVCVCVCVCIFTCLNQRKCAC